MYPEQKMRLYHKKIEWGKSIKVRNKKTIVFGLIFTAALHLHTTQTIRSTHSDKSSSHQAVYLGWFRPGGTSPEENNTQRRKR